LIAYTTQGFLTGLLLLLLLLQNLHSTHLNTSKLESRGAGVAMWGISLVEERKEMSFETSFQGAN